MGQQQLILLVLATVIVGVAIVVGITAFTENSAKSNADALMQDAVRMANDVQAAVEKPEPFGGVDSYANITFGVLGYPNTDGTYTNLNGDFTLNATSEGVVITGNGGNSTTDSNSNEVYEQEVVVAVCGQSDEDITGAITRIGNQNALGSEETAPTCGSSV